MEVDILTTANIPLSKNIQDTKLPLMAIAGYAWSPKHEDVLKRRSDEK